MHADRPDSADDRARAAIGEAAARWLARRDRGLSPRETAEFQRWSAADPRHAAEFARLERAWRDFDLAGAVPELVAMAGELDRATAARPCPRSRSWPRGFAAAAAIALLAGVAWWRVDHGAAEDRTIAAPAYQVLASSARRVELADGSIAAVREDGQIRTAFSAVERRVELVQGEAHFKVEKDAARPFVVVAGATVVRAVGTAFNVRLDPGRVEVWVTEGKVELAEAKPAGSVAMEAGASVVAGQRAVIDRETLEGGIETPAKVEITAAAPAEMDQALAWQSTRLVFDRTPLEEAVDAFNRYSASESGITLVIGDATLRARRIGGTFRTTNVEGFVRLLERGVEIRAEHKGDEIVLLPAR